MINAKTREAGTQKTNYPCLKETSGGLMVLFVRLGAGVVIATEDNDQTIGSYSDTWDMDRFEDFNGVVELSNEHG